MKTTQHSTWDRCWVSLKAPNLLYSEASYCVEFPDSHRLLHSFSDGLGRGDHQVWSRHLITPSLCPCLVPSDAAWVFLSL